MKRVFSKRAPAVHQVNIWDPELEDRPVPVPDTQFSRMHTFVEVIKCELGRPKRVTSQLDLKAPAKKWTPLQYAAYSGREAALRHFLKSGQPIDGLQYTAESPLCTAAAAGHLPIVQLLCEAGADVQATSETGETALHIAIRNGRADILDTLLSYRPNLEVKTTATGETPLHYAAKLGSLSGVVALLKCGARYDCLNNDMQSPAEVAFEKKNIPVAVAIISAARGTRKLAKEKEMLLRYVEKSQNRFSLNNELIGEVFEAGCDPKSTVLVEAIKRDDPSLVQMFLEKGYDPNRRTAKGLHPLIAAMDGANSQIVRLLVKHGADTSVRSPDRRTLLQVALAGPRVLEKEAIFGVCEALLQHDADPFVIDSYGRTLLHHAVKHENHLAKVAQLLLQCGVKVNARDNAGCTALHVAVNSKSCVDLLLKHGANPNQLNADGYTPLHLAVSSSMSTAAQMDIESLVRASDVRLRDREQRTALHLAAENGLEKAVRTLLKYKADCTVPDATGCTPLLLAAKAHRWTITNLLSMQPGTNSWDKDGKTALHYIAMSSPDPSLTWADVASAAKKFCERGMSRAMRDRSGATALIQAVKTLDGKGVAVVEVLLSEAGPRPGRENCVNHEDHGQRSALYHAATLGKHQFVALLLKYGAAMNLRDWTSKGPLRPVDRDQKKVLRLLADHEWKRRARMLQRSEMSRVISIPDLKQLLWMGLDVNALPGTDTLLWTVLRQYQTHGSSEYLTDVFHIILAAEADPNIASPMGTPKPLNAHSLVFAIEQNLPIDVIQLLLLQRGDPNAKSPFHEGRTPLHASVKGSRMDILQIILKHGVDVNAVDAKGQTSLFLATSKGIPDTVKMLIDRGADVNIRSEAGDTCLHRATAIGNIAIVSMLLRAGARVHMQNKKGLTPSKCCAPESHALLALLGSAERRQAPSIAPHPAYTIEKAQKPKASFDSLDKETRIHEVSKAQHPIERPKPSPRPSKDGNEKKSHETPLPSPAQLTPTSIPKTLKKEKKSHETPLPSPAQLTPTSIPKALKKEKPASEGAKEAKPEKEKRVKAPRVDSGFSMHILSKITPGKKTPPVPSSPQKPTLTSSHKSNPHLPLSPRPKLPQVNKSMLNLNIGAKGKGSAASGAKMQTPPMPPTKSVSPIPMNQSMPTLPMKAGHAPPVPSKDKKERTGTADDFSDWLAMSKMIDRL